MHVGAKKVKAKYKLDKLKVAVITEEIDLGVIISNNSKVGKQCDKAKNKGNQILGAIK